MKRGYKKQIGPRFKKKKKCSTKTYSSCASMTLILSQYMDHSSMYVQHPGNNCTRGKFLPCAHTCTDGSCQRPSPPPISCPTSLSCYLYGVPRTERPLPKSIVMHLSASQKETRIADLAATEAYEDLHYLKQKTKQTQYTRLSSSIGKTHTHTERKTKGYSVVTPACGLHNRRPNAFQQ